ncbi:hypothetical protein [Acetivibrio cellulolyticus]|uniref:hypothetical protein n=1 Tax=Acetivibrio cellulolyticus TaxID=35830 RepID=UPI0001E2F67E|nr:hypothetical protein [Acetivibrio cellulolyticus]
MNEAIGKDRVRSIRLSARVEEIINNQPGDKFTSKLERFVLELNDTIDERRKYLDKVNREIVQKEQELRNIKNKISSIGDIAKSISKIQSEIEHLGDSIKQYKVI